MKLKVKSSAELTYPKHVVHYSKVKMAGKHSTYFHVDKYVIN